MTAVALYGLGIIGVRVAGNLQRAGYPTAVWSRTPRVDFPGFREDVLAVAKSARVHQIFVRDDEALMGLIETILPVLTPDDVVLNHSTVSPRATRVAHNLLRQREVAFLDAPFTGSRDAAEAGQLVFYVGGEEEVLELVRPVLEVNARVIHYFGVVGNATVLKLATNMMSATIVEILAEAAALTMAAGVELRHLQTALQEHAIRSKLIDMKMPAILNQDFTTHFSLQNMLKDAGYALDMAADQNVNLPAFRPVAERMRNLAEESPQTAEADFSILGRRYTS